MSPIIGGRGAGVRGLGFQGAAPAGVPGQVAGLTATDVGTGRAYNNGAINLSWSAPASNGAPITGYLIERSTDNTNWSTLVANTGTTSTTYQNTGMASAVTLFYRVSAINTVGTGSASSSSSATVTTVPEAPTIGTATAGNASATVTYTANATGGKPVNYSATSSPASFFGGTGASPITVSSLTNGTSYTFKVTATNANGSSISANSNSITPINPLPMTWTSVVPSTGNANIFSTGYGNGIYLLGSSSSAMAWSSNRGVTWSNVGATLHTRAISYGNGRYLWGGSGNTVSFGVDHPVVLNSGATTNLGTSGMMAMAYGNSLWVASGHGGQIRTSTNSTTWNTQTSNLAGTTRTVAYGNSLWLVGGDLGTRSSTNGITWSTIDLSGPRSIAYGDGKWVSVALSGIVRTSTDTITWTTQNSNTSLNLSSVAYGNGVWAAVGGVGTSGVAIVSTDSITWSTSPLNHGGTLQSISYGNGLWIAAGFAAGTVNAVYISGS